MLKPLPRGVLEHGGSENPIAEVQLSVPLRDEQEAWFRKERESECHVLKKEWETLAQSGFAMSHVAVKYGHEEDIARNILEEARSGQHETIVVGRQGTSRIKQIFGGGVTDQLLRDAKGFAIWVVEGNSQCRSIEHEFPVRGNRKSLLEEFVSAPCVAGIQLRTVDFRAVDAGDKLTECHTT